MEDQKQNENPVEDENNTNEPMPAEPSAEGMSVEPTEPVESAVIPEVTPVAEEQPTVPVAPAEPIAEAPQEEVVGTPSPEPEKSHLGLYVLVFIIAVIIGGSWFYYSNFYGKDEVKDATPQTEVQKTKTEDVKSDTKTTTDKKIDTKTDTKTDTKIDTAKPTIPTPTKEIKVDYTSWSTFKDDIVGYTMKHPKDWTTKLDYGEYDENYDHLDDNTGYRFVKFTSPDKKYALHVGITKKDSKISTSNKIGNVKGEFKDGEKIKIVGTEIQVTKLVYKGNTQKYFFNSQSKSKSKLLNDAYTFNGNLSYLDFFVNLETYSMPETTPEYVAAKKILQSLEFVKK